MLSFFRKNGVKSFRRTFTELLEGAEGPVCHVGSKNREASEKDIRAFRGLFSNIGAFTGIDIEEGPNVDLVADLSSDGFKSEHPELAGRFGFVFCSALLEHVPNPFITASNVEWLLKEGGRLYYAGPWVWGYHPYPDDYWRFSFSALKVLFPKVMFADWWYEGTKSKVGIRIDQKMERAVFQLPKVGRNAAHISDRSMPYLNVCAIGTKKHY